MMNKVVELKEKLNNKPKVTRAKSILESLGKTRLNEWMNKDEVNILKKKAKENAPKGWKGSLSWSPYAGGRLTFKVQGIPLKDLKEMAYVDLKEYTSVNGISWARSWENGYVLKSEYINEETKQIDKRISDHISPPGGNNKLTEKYILDNLRPRFKPTAKATKELVKMALAVLEGGYNNSDSMSDYFDQSHSFEILISEDKPTKVL